MKKLISIFIIQALLQQYCFAQNHFIAEFKFPEKKIITANILSDSPSVTPFLIRAVFTEEDAKKPLLLFNDQPVLVPVKQPKKAIRFLTELSFSDLLENSANRLKTGLINTYDDNITELFKEAPSLVKFKCIIPF